MGFAQVLRTHAAHVPSPLRSVEPYGPDWETIDDQGKYGVECTTCAQMDSQAAVLNDPELARIVRGWVLLSAKKKKRVGNLIERWVSRNDLENPFT